MLPPSVEPLRRSASTPDFAPERENSRRTVHSGSAWAAVADDAVTPLYQPQDSPSGIRRAAAAAAETEDARLTGGTRSLMRRLSGLNLNAKRHLAVAPAPTPRTA